ncbi:MAG: TIGR01777 family oxidoreductase [Verrucomicrobiaceae bacterium]
MKKVVIAGANGFLGRYLSRWFLDRDWEVVGLSRNAGVIEGVVDRRWDAVNPGDWQGDLEGAEVLVNLAGRSVNCRYGEQNRKLILESRVVSTRVLGEAIAGCRCPPKFWLNSSTATIYRHAEDRAQDEVSGEIGSGFSVGIANAWEEAFFQSVVPGEVRKVAMRTAMVIANEPGTVYDYLATLSRWWLGGTMGSGHQRVSWIHVEDFCRVVDWLISNHESEGIYNVVAPTAQTNREVMEVFRKVEGRRWGLPASKLMLEAGAFLLRTETEMVLKSRWVVPGRLEKGGFVFRWPELGPALMDLKVRGGFKSLGGSGEIL